MKPTKLLAALGLMLAAICVTPVLAADVISPAPKTTDADTLLRQMSAKLGAATNFSFTARREIGQDLAGGDGLHGKPEITVAVHRPDKMVASATIPGDVRRLYFDGKQLTLADEQKNVYSSVPMAVSLDRLPAELTKTYGFTPPLAEFLLTDLYQDLTWRAQNVEYRGEATLNTGSPELKGVRCHRLGLTGRRADSELWIATSDLLPRQWISKVKGTTGEVEIRFEFLKWNLEAKTPEADFVFSPAEDALEVPMISEAEMAAVRAVGK